MKQKKSKKIQNGRLKTTEFFNNPPIVNIFSWKFRILILGLVGWIDANGSTYMVIRLSLISSISCKKQEKCIFCTKLSLCRTFLLKQNIENCGYLKNLGFFEWVILNYFFCLSVFKSEGAVELWNTLYLLNNTINMYLFEV